MEPKSAGNPFKGRSGLTRIWNALGYSLAGCRSAYRHEHAFRQELWLAGLLLPVALLLPATPTQKALLLGSLLLVLIVELLNSALEAAVDRISLEYHDLIKRAKDIASAAVFLSLIHVLVVWGLILLELYG